MAKDQVIKSQYQLFTARKPRSRVRRDIVNRVRNIIDSYPELEDSSFVNIKDLKEVEGSYFLITEEGADDTGWSQSLVEYLEEQQVSLEQKFKWALKIAEIGRKAEKKGYIFSEAISLNCLRVNKRGQLKMLPPEIVETIKQYNEKLQNIIPPENYTPPELIEGGSWGNSGVLYTFGIVLYYLITGRPPFSVSRKAGTYDKILASSYIKAHVANPRLAPEVSQIIKKLFYRNKSQRYQSWQDVNTDLEELINNEKYQASGAQFKRNKATRKLIFAASAARDKVTFFLKRSWKFIAAGTVLVLVMFLLSYTTAPDPIITEADSPHDVIDIFYEGFHEKAEDKVKAASSFELGELESFIAESYIVEQMYVYSTDLSPGTDVYQLGEDEVVYGIKDLFIQEIDGPTDVNGSRVSEYKAHYIFFMNQGQGSERERHTEEMVDSLYLEKQGGIWQITEVEGSIQRLIDGVFFDDDVDRVNGG